MEDWSDTHGRVARFVSPMHWISISHCLAELVRLRNALATARPIFHLHFEPHGIALSNQIKIHRLPDGQVAVKLHDFGNRVYLLVLKSNDVIAGL